MSQATSGTSQLTTPSLVGWSIYMILQALAITFLFEEYPHIALFCISTVMIAATGIMTFVPDLKEHDFENRVWIKASYVTVRTIGFAWHKVINIGVSMGAIVFIISESPEERGMIANGGILFLYLFAAWNVLWNFLHGTFSAKDPSDGSRRKEPFFRILTDILLAVFLTPFYLRRLAKRSQVTRVPSKETPKTAPVPSRPATILQTATVNRQVDPDLSPVGSSLLDEALSPSDLFPDDLFDSDD